MRSLFPLILFFGLAAGVVAGSVLSIVQSVRF